MKIYCNNEGKNFIETNLLPPYMRRISDEKLENFYKKIKPIISIEAEKYLLKEFTLEQLHDKSFKWDDEKNKSIMIDQTKLEIIYDFLCLHVHKDSASLIEIISQIPDNITTIANSFEIIETPEKREHLLIHSRGLHLSKIRTYRINR